MRRLSRRVAGAARWRRALPLAAVAVSGVAAITSAQLRVDDAVLARKKLFADEAVKALAEPFVGVRAGSELLPGLFPIRATGVSTTPVREAATAFLRTLTPAQVNRTLFAVDDPEWRRWSNVDNGLFLRQGLSLREMSRDQQQAAHALLSASLSAKGLAQTEAIRKTDRLLAEINADDARYDEQLYFFTLMGQPSPTEPWGWQIDGHHLVINYFVLGDQVVMTPVFMGGEPAFVSTGTYAGNRVLQAEQDAGLAFMRSLTPAQRAAATIRRDKVGNDIQAEANKDNLVLPATGLEVSTLPTAGKTALRDLIGLYVANLRDDHARVRMQEIEAHLDRTLFAWAGGTTDDAVFYYRIQSPVILIEFDHQQPVGTRRIATSPLPTRAHIHTVVRTPNGNDYGKDLLRQHLLRHPH